MALYWIKLRNFWCRRWYCHDKLKGYSTLFWIQLTSAVFFFILYNVTRLICYTTIYWLVSLESSTGFVQWVKTLIYGTNVEVFSNNVFSQSRRNTAISNRQVGACLDLIFSSTSNEFQSCTILVYPYLSGYFSTSVAVFLLHFFIIFWSRFPRILWQPHSDFEGLYICRF